MLKLKNLGFILGILAFVGLSNGMFVINQKDRAVVLRFGKIVRVCNDPGLSFKVPFLESVVFLSKRLQGYVMQPLEVNDVKQKKIVVDLYVRYVISNPALYLKNIGNGDFFASHTAKQVIDDRLSHYVSSAMRNIIGRYTIADLLSVKREGIMAEITKNILNRAVEVGLQVKDVRIVNFNLPAENLNNVFKRMESDREREAKRLKADGKKQATEIKAKAEKDRIVILAQARNKAKEIMGEAELAVSQIYAGFTKKADVDDFLFLRSLAAYKKSFSDGTKHVIGKNLELDEQ